MSMRSFALLAILTLAPLCALHADEASKPPDNAEAKKPVGSAPTIPEPVTKSDSVTIDGKKIDYEVTAGTLRIERGKESADVFHVSYRRTNGGDAIDRPVMFAFNGGPGSSAVWLHMGMLGPRIIDLPGDGTEPPLPPVRTKPNVHSLLDVCDLVFVDPVTTGYSRAEDETKAGHFHGLDADIEAVGEFVRRWITEHDRWASPKYLLGESYGGLRAAGLADYLQSRHGMSLNGVVLLSAILDYATVKFPPGQDQAYSIFLPAYTAVAHHHGKISGDRDQLVSQSAEFAFTDYTVALMLGADITKERKTAAAAKLESMTGIASDIWLQHDLRIAPFQFRAELLRKEGKTLGRFDARVAWDSMDPTALNARQDPSYSLALGAFATGLKDYLGREIGYKLDEPYEILTGKVHPWNWNRENAIVNVSDRLASAMRNNPRLKVLVMSAHADLATPPECMGHSLRHLPDLPHSLRANIRTEYYEAGHMFYLYPPDLKKSRGDLLRFLEAK